MVKHRVMVATIGCCTYIVHPEDAVTLLEIGQRCRLIEGYPRKLADDNKPLLDSIAYEEIEFSDKDKHVLFMERPLT